MMRLTAIRLASWATGAACLAGLAAAPSRADEGPPLDWHEIEPDAIVWAKPSVDKPVKALFLCYDLGTAEAMSVAHRLPLDYRTFEIGTAWSYANLNRPEKRDALLQLLREDFDVCVIAGGIGLIWMSIGAFIMAKMVSFEI